MSDVYKSSTDNIIVTHCHYDNGKYIPSKYHVEGKEIRPCGVSEDLTEVIFKEVESENNNPFITQCAMCKGELRLFKDPEGKVYHGKCWIKLNKQIGDK